MPKRDPVSVSVIPIGEVAAFHLPRLDGSYVRILAFEDVHEGMDRKERLTLEIIRSRPARKTEA